MEWKLSTTIKGPAGEGAWYSNIVGIMLIGDEEKEYIYKVSRLPSFRPFWERAVSRKIQEHLPGLIHFSKILSVYSLSFDVDEMQRTLPSTKNNKKKQKQRFVSIQKVIHGLSLSDHIRYGRNTDFIFSALFQILATLNAAKSIQFTHYDVHCSNILMEKEKNVPLKSSLFYFYDFDQPILVPSFGYRAKLIDYEFSHVKTDVSFDSRFDLMDVGYSPNRFDPSYDSIRVVTSCCAYAGEVGGHEICSKISRELIDIVNECGSRKFKCDGVLESQTDEIKKILSGSLQGNAKKLVDERFYHLVSLIMHTTNTPLKSTVEFNENSVLCLMEFFKTLSTVSEYSDECCVYLYNFIEQKCMHDSGEWNVYFTRIIQNAAIVLESYYAKESEKIEKQRKEQREGVFVPINMIYILQQEYQIQKIIKPGDLILHMTASGKRYVTVKNLPILKDINSNFDLFRRGRLIKEMLELYH
jgi:hypothetical protein